AGVHHRRRTRRGALRSRLVQALQGNAVRLRALSPARGLRAHHEPARRRTFVVLSTDAGAISAARDVFRTARYTNRSVTELLGTGPTLHLDSEGRTRAAFLVDPSQPLGALVALFLLENEIGSGEATAALGGDGVDALERAGLIERDGGRLR